MMVEPFARIRVVDISDDVDGEGEIEGEFGLGGEFGVLCGELGGLWGDDGGDPELTLCDLVRGARVLDICVRRFPG